MTFPTVQFAVLIPFKSSAWQVQKPFPCLQVARWSPQESKVVLTFFFQFAEK